jgi:AraC-like DNA-binding protein
MCDPYEFYHYLPVNDDAMRWGIYVTGAGRGHIPARGSYPPEGHPSLYQFDWKRGRTLPEFQLILITDGQGEFTSQATQGTPVEPNTLITLFPGVWHSYRPDPSTGWQERWISLNGETIHRLMDQGLIHPAKSVQPVKDVETLTRVFDGLLSRIHTDPQENSILLSLRAMNLMAEGLEQTLDEPLPSAAQASNLPRHASDTLIAQAMDLIWTHSHRPLSVDQVVAQLPATRRTLERRFATEHGHSILEEINTCRLSRARRLLRETDLPVKSVAPLAGFTSRERMRIAFQNHENCSPDQYRRGFRISIGD